MLYLCVPLWACVCVCASVKSVFPYDFPGGPEVKNPPCNAGDAGLISGQGTRSHMPQ